MQHERFRGVFSHETALLAHRMINSIVHYDPVQFVQKREIHPFITCFITTIGGVNGGYAQPGR